MKPLRSLCARFGLSKVSRPLARKRRAFLGLEQLEDRCVPATFNVNTLADTDAVSLVTGLDASGKISLRSAIEAANAQSAGSTINLTVAGTYAAVSGHGGTDQSTTGAFTILPSSGGLTITNTSGGAVLVAGSGFDRVFDINPADHLIACTVAMSGFTIESGTAAGNGGGIRDQGPVSLTLINMVLTNNMATANGGGLSMANATNQEWTLTIYNSAISTNSAGGAGGGIETEGSGQVAMSGDVINANKAQNGGAGIWLGGIATPPGSVQSTIITAGGSGYIGTPNVAFTEPGAPNIGQGTATVVGGAVTGITITNPADNSGFTAAPSVTFSTGPANGSGLAATATASLVNNGNPLNPVSSTIVVTSGGFNYTQAPMVKFVNAPGDTSGGGAAATATVDAAGQVTAVTLTAGGNYALAPTIEFIPTGSGAAAIAIVPTQSATLTFTQSVLSHNEALAAGAIGGGIGTAGNGAVTVTSSTLTTNSAAGSGGGFGDAGGQTTVTFVNDTLVVNSAGTDGGGFYAFGKSLVTLENSTFTSNTAQVSGGGVFVAPYATPITFKNDITAGNGPAGAAVASTLLTSPGNGYTSTPTVTITPAPGDTTGSGATAIAVWVPSGISGIPGNVVAVILTSAGSGYTLPPNVSVTGGGGSGAKATAALAPTSQDIAAPVGLLDGDVIGIFGQSLTVEAVTPHDLSGSLASPVNPMLGPLQNNGGFPPTEAPLPGSPVIDAGDAAANPATDPISGAALTDQRGGLRVVGSNVDAGAVEFQLGDTTTSLTASVATATQGAPVTFTAHVQPTAAAPNNPVTGTVTLTEAGLTVGTGTLDANGNATIATTSLVPGPNAVTAIYTPDTNAQELGFTTSTSTNVPITVTQSSTSGAPMITSPQAVTFTISTAGSFAVTTTGEPTPTLSHNGTLPAGLSFNSAAGMLIISGTPAAGTAGTYPITFTASNGVGTDATQNFTLTVTASGTPPPSASAPDELGAYRASNGSWSLDSDGTPGFNAATDQVFFSFSPANAVGVAGDWTGSGTSKVGDFSNGTWHLDLNDNGVLDPGETFTFGQAGDQPVVGDWTGSGVSNIGVFRTAPDGITGEFILDTNGDHIMDASDETFTFGLGTDRIVIGDWNGGGKDEVGVFRDAVSFIPADVGDAVFSLDTNNNHTFDAGDQVFVFGLITDKVVIGDWNGNGVSKVGVYRDGSTASGAFSSLDAPGTALFSLDTNGDRQFDSGDQVFLYGLTTDQFVTGHWAKTPPVQPEGTPQAQFAANGPGSGGVTPLTEAQLEPVLQQAILNWEAQGASAAQLESAQVQIGTLNNNFVGLTSGNQITIDATADGWGWNTDTSTVAAGRMDLLTVVEHELGHELGLSDVDPATHPGDLMAATLPTGTRRLIGG